jgi:hypothetical protein
VVLEGYDEGIARKILLSRLYATGIRYLQGYIVGAPDEGLMRLNNDRKEYLKSLIENTV